MNIPENPRKTHGASLADSRPSPGTLTLTIPMRLQRRRGRKHIIVPDGLAPDANIPAQPQDAVLIALARAHVWKEGLESGRFRSIQHIARTLDVDSSYIGRLLRLTLLPPGVQEEMLGGGDDWSLEGLVCRESNILLWSHWRIASDSRRPLVPPRRVNPPRESERQD